MQPIKKIGPAGNSLNLKGNIEDSRNHAPQLFLLIGLYTQIPFTPPLTLAGVPGQHGSPQCTKKTVSVEVSSNFIYTVSGGEVVDIFHVFKLQIADMTCTRYGKAVSSLLEWGVSRKEDRELSKNSL